MSVSAHDPQIEVRIRDAEPSDADTLAVFAASLFRATYATSTAPADLELRAARTFSSSAQAREIAAPDWRTLLAEIDDTLVGYAQLCFAPGPACVTAANGGAANVALEIKRFYVAPARHGRGVAQRLMDVSLQIAPAGVPVWLGVFSGNPRAIAFYTKAGFRVVGEQVFHMGHDPQRDWVMARAP